MDRPTRPRALLLDFGGVVVSAATRAAWSAELAAEVHRQLGAVGFDGLTADEIRTDIEAGAAADRAWKDAMSRPYAPEEMTHRRYWAEFVAADWPAQARALVTAHAAALCRLQGGLRQERRLREGIEDVLGYAAGQGITAGIVSNSLSGLVHREFMEASGLDKLVALQLYSDEAGVRKPNPELILAACRSLGVPPGEAWYVGDTLDRDVVCGRRAKVGLTVLMDTPGAGRRPPYAVRDTPDVVVAGPRELLDLLRSARVPAGPSC